MKAARLWLCLASLLITGLALLGLLSALSPADAAGTPVERYVSPTGSDVSNDCTAPVSPCQSVQHALDVALPEDIVKVAAGTYTGTSARDGTTQLATISKTVVLRGGFTTTNWTNPIPTDNPTTLDAQGQGRVLYVAGDIHPTVEGLRITGGDAAGQGGTMWGDGGGGIYVNATDVLISGCVIYSNTAQGGGGLCLYNSRGTLANNAILSNTADVGGGVYLGLSEATLSGNEVSANRAQGVFGGGLGLWYSQATLNGNTISGNRAKYGGGLHLMGGEATLTGNVISGNWAEFDGGGLYLEENTASLASNRILENEARYDGGGLDLRDGHAMLINNLLALNRAQGNGLALRARASSPRMLHTTLVGNGSAGGGAIYATEFQGVPSKVYLTNTILISHGVGVFVTTGCVATLEATLWGAGRWGNTVDWAGTGTVLTGTRNYWGDPALVDPEAGDYGIAAGSSAIDRGVHSDALTDIDGEPRPWGAAPDLGADESQALVTLTPSYVEHVLPGASLRYIHTLRNNGSTTDTYDLSWSSSRGYARLLTTAPLTVGAGLTATVLVSVTVPADDTGGLVETTLVTATSWADPARQAVATDRAIVVQGSWRINLPLVMRDHR